MIQLSSVSLTVPWYKAVSTVLFLRKVVRCTGERCRVSDLLALDPSIARCGLALFHDGDLIASGCVAGLHGLKDTLARVVYISEACTNWVLQQSARPDEFIVEWPQVYTRDKSKGDPKGLLPLAGVAGCVAGILIRTPALTPLNYDLECVSYLPGEWSGRVPKVETVKGCKTSPRAVKVKSRLNAAELLVWEKVKYHDAIDAIGIGLHHLGRFKRKRVYPR